MINFTVLLFKLNKYPFVSYIIIIWERIRGSKKVLRRQIAGWKAISHPTRPRR